MDRYVLPDGTEISAQEIQSMAERQGITFFEVINNLGAKKFDGENIVDNDNNKLTFFDDIKNGILNAGQELMKIPEFATGF